MSRARCGCRHWHASHGGDGCVLCDCLIFRPEAQTPTEIRLTDPDTGGQKGTKLARFDLIPAGPLWQLAEHYGKGALKYDEHNWRRGYKWSLSFAAMMRHAWAWWRGEDNDPDTGSSHLVAIAWHAFTLLESADTHREKDDRWKG